MIAVILRFMFLSCGFTMVFVFAGFGIFFIALGLSQWNGTLFGGNG